MDEHNIIYKRCLDDNSVGYLMNHFGGPKRVLNLCGTWYWFFYRIRNGFISREECTPEFMLWAINYFGSNVLDNFLTVYTEDEIPEFVKLAAAKRANWGDIFKTLKRPSDAVINAQLKIAGQAILDLPNPTKQQIMLALAHSTESPWLITKINKPTIQMQKIHVAHYPEGIDYIKNPCEKVKIAAAKAHGVEVLKQKNMQHPSEQILLTAIDHTWGMDDLAFFLRYIPHPNQKIYCAIKHQIKKSKKILDKLRSEYEANLKPYEPTLEFLQHACGDPLAVVQVCKNLRSEKDKIAALEKLREKNWHNPFFDNTITR